MLYKIGYIFCPAGSTACDELAYVFRWLVAYKLVIVEFRKWFCKRVMFLFKTELGFVKIYFCI